MTSIARGSGMWRPASFARIIEKTSCNHESNRLGAACFAASLLLLVVGLGASAGVVARSLATNAMSRRWARLAGVAVLAACTAFAGVAVTPENRLMPLHVAFTVWAWRIVPAIAVFLGIASRTSTHLRRRAAIAWFGAATLLATCTGLLAWGPSLDRPDGLLMQVVAQKAATVVLIAALLIATSEVDRADRLKERAGHDAFVMRRPAGTLLDDAE